MLCGCSDWRLRMRPFSLILLLLPSLESIYGSTTVVSVKVDHGVFPRLGVTEPAWVTELLGPTEFPITTTKRPSFPNRIRESINTSIKHVQTHIHRIPDRINEIIDGFHKNLVHQGAPRRPVNSTTSLPAQFPYPGKTT